MVRLIRMPVNHVATLSLDSAVDKTTYLFAARKLLIGLTYHLVAEKELQSTSFKWITDTELAKALSKQQLRVTFDYAPVEAVDRTKLRTTRLAGWHLRHRLQAAWPSICCTWTLWFPALMRPRPCQLENRRWMGCQPRRALFHAVR